MKQLLLLLLLFLLLGAPSCQSFSSVFRGSCHRLQLCIRADRSRARERRRRWRVWCCVWRRRHHHHQLQFPVNE